MKPNRAPRALLLVALLTVPLAVAPRSAWPLPTEAVSLTLTVTSGCPSTDQRGSAGRTAQPETSGPASAAPARRTRAYSRCPCRAASSACTTWRPKPLLSLDRRRVVDSDAPVLVHCRYGVDTT